MNRLARRIIGVLVSAMSAISFSSEACAQLFDNYTDAEQFGKDRLQALRKENVAHPMQYVVLKKDASLVKGLNPYTVYEIRAVLDLDAATLEIPAHCVIIFNGGAFKNGTLVGNDTKYCLKQAYSKCFQCRTDGTFEKIDYVIKATDAGMTANSPSRANANYSRLKSLITEGKNVFFDGKFYVNFSSPVVLKRVAHLYGGEMVYKKNAFQFANGGGIVVCGTVITASNDARSSFFIGAKDLLGAIDIKAISFQGCTIDCPYLVNVLYKDMNSDSVSFGVRCIDVDHCVFKDTGRFRVMDAVIAGRCSFTNNDYQKFTTTPIYIACQHSVQGSPNDKSAYQYVAQNLQKGCPVIIDNNIFTGEPVSLNYYYCSALVKAVDCVFTNNYLQDIINYSDGKTNAIATAYDAYLSCVNVVYENNFVKDMMSYCRNGAEKPNNQIGKSKTNPLSIIGLPASRIYRNNAFIVDGTRFLKLGADAASLYTDIFGNVSYIDTYVWENNTLIYKSAGLKTGVSSKSYGTFRMENNYFETENVTGNGLITVRSNEQVDTVLIRNNTFKVSENQLYPVFNQRFNQSYKREFQKNITITDNQFVNSSPKVFFHTGEHITVRNNGGEAGDISGNLYLSKFSGAGTVLDVNQMDVDLAYNKKSRNSGGLMQYFSSGSHGKYALGLDQIPDKGVNYTYALDQDDDFTISLRIAKGRKVEEVSIPIHYRRGTLSYEWKGKTVKVASGKADSVVWYKGDGVQFRTSFYASGKNQIVTRVQSSGSATKGVRYSLTFQSE